MLKLAPSFSTSPLFILAVAASPVILASLEVAGVVYPVEKVKKQGDDVLHFLGGTDPLPAPNSAASCAWTLDWVRRYQLMRTHYSFAHPVRHGLPRLRREGHWRRHGPAQGTHGF